MTHIERRHLLALILIGASAASTGAAQPVEKPTNRPNIVFILADDLGIGDVNCFGGDRCLIETPHMDALAKQGMRFTDAHSVASVCVPSRLAIMTGRYPWRIRGAKRNGPWGFLNPRLPTTHHTIGRMLTDAGYNTGYVGKWHLGTEMQTTDGQLQGPANVDYRKPLKTGPSQFGFPESFILPGSLDMFPYAFAQNGRWVGEVTAQKGWSAFNRIGPAAEDFEDVKVLDTFSMQAEQFIDRHAVESNSGKPFFLFLALTSPHTPVAPRAEFQGKSKLGPYGDFVMETDDCVGRVVAALTKHKLTDNTLVLVASDHGAASYAGNILKATPGQIHDLEKIGHYPSSIYRGYKFSIYEGGNRVPFIVRWPGVVKPESTCDQLVGLNDLMATLADALGITLNANETPDSISMLPLLKDADSVPTRRSMILQSIQTFAVRLGRWKLAVCPGSGAAGVYGNVPKREDAWRAAIEDFGRNPTREELRSTAFVQLFDLVTDPTESKNVAKQNPERVRRMFSILDDRIRRGRSTVGPLLRNDFAAINVHPRIPSFVLSKKPAK